MTNNEETYHVPVMLQECLDGLNINPDGIYVDVTFGGGGHAKEIYKRLSPKGKLIVFDQDPDAAANAWEAPNFHFVASNFSYMNNHLRMMQIDKVDGILAMHSRTGGKCCCVGRISVANFKNTCIPVADLF